MYNCVLNFWTLFKLPSNKNTFISTLQNKLRSLSNLFINKKFHITVFLTLVVTHSGKYHMWNLKMDIYLCFLLLGNHTPSENLQKNRENSLFFMPTTPSEIYSNRVLVKLIFMFYCMSAVLKLKMVKTDWTSFFISFMTIPEVKWW